MIAPLPTTGPTPPEERVTNEVFAAGLATKTHDELRLLALSLQDRVNQIESQLANVRVEFDDDGTCVATDTYHADKARWFAKAKGALRLYKWRQRAVALHLKAQGRAHTRTLPVYFMAVAKRRLHEDTYAAILDEARVETEAHT